jgi:hypothetical protein
MTQEDKEILLKDLCARLPYGVKAEKYTIRMDGEVVSLEIIEIVTAKDIIARDECPGYIIKPYLLPLSSMTEEQREELRKFDSFDTEEIMTLGEWAIRLVDFYNKYHFDYRGLIEKGLAIDATNLNVY